MHRFIALFRSILEKNEHKAYTELANIDWKKTYKVEKECHLEESGLNYFMHAIQSVICAWFFFKLFIFCLIWHPIFPNIAPHYATNKLKNFDTWYKDLNRKLKVFKWKAKRKVNNFPNPFKHIGY